jgi:hypothetical protein
MTFDAALLLCPFTIVLGIFTLKKDNAKTHFNNVKLNVLNNAPLAVYYAVLAGHSLIMGLKTNSSLVDMRLSKIEVTIENIVFLAAIGNLVVNQLMEHEAIAAVTAKVAFAEEPQWTIVIAKNVHHVVR